MKHPWQVWILFSLSVLIALAAMAWLSVQTLRMDRERQQARSEAELEQQIGLVLWRMDTFLAPIIAEEAARPSDFYQPAIAANAPANDAQAVQTSAPAFPATSPNVWLNFTCDATGRWSSPQVPEGVQSPPELEVRRKQLTANPGTLLEGGSGRESLRDQTALGRALKQLAEDVSVSELIAQLPEQPLPVRGEAANAVRENSFVVGNDATATPPAGKFSKGDREDLQQRNLRFQDVAQQELRKQRGGYGQRSYGQGGYGQGGYGGGGYGGAVAQASMLVESVSRPVWAGDKLLLARRVDRGAQTEVQGSWLDWPRLKRLLLAEAADVLPHADLAKVRTMADANPARMLASLPVELVVAPVEVMATISTPTRWALSMGWGALVVAAGAMAMLLRGVMALSERRAAFVSSVTHELRTPLTTFRMYSEMLAKDMVPDAHRRQEYLDTLQRESQRLTHLVENVLSYARLERGRGLGQRERIAAATLVERMKVRLAERAEQAQMQLVVAFGKDAAETMLTTDLGVVEQILFNLVDNAAKYAATAEDRRIHLEIDRDAGKLNFTVTDSGPGFKMHTPARRRFVPFGKSAEEAAVSAPGVGLGLALCRRLAIQLGGSLQVVSSGEPGAAVRLQLPVG